MSSSSSRLEQINLVSSRPEDDAQMLDPAFINAWGIAIRPAGMGGHWWIANTDTSRVTLYVGDSETVPFKQDGLSVLGVPGAAGPDIEIPIDPPTQGGVPLAAPSPTPATVMPPSNPTGQVFSGSNTDFLVDGTSLTGTALVDAPARFITVSEDGTIAAWGEFGSSPAQRMNAFAVVVDNSATGAIYKGVTVSSDGGSGNFLYAANFSQGRIDVFDAAWAPVVSGGFAPVAPGGRDAAEFSPFNIERVHDSSRGEDVLIVAYAKIGDAAAGEEESTDGFIAKYTLDGTFLAASDAGGLFNAPWGVALADGSFGAYGGMLLVGNFGDGRIVALDIDSLEPEGYLLDAHGEPVFIDGLWDLIVGNGASLGRTDRVYFSAGPDEEAEGLFGSLSVGADIDADDSFAGTAGRDVHSGASGDDVLQGQAGDDTLLGQLGDDYLRGGDGHDTLFGGYGDDQILGDAGEDRLAGGRGDDFLDGGAGEDDLVGGAGSDVLSGGTGTDTLSGGADDDYLMVDAADTGIDGGAGFDSLFVRTGAAATLDMGVASIEWAQGNAGFDAFDAGSQAAAVYIYGQGGDDTLLGSAFGDYLDGGDGIDVLVGGAGNDVLLGNAGADIMLGQGGDDTLVELGGDIRIDGGAGFDSLFVWSDAGVTLDLAANSIEWVQGSVLGDDALNGAGNTVNTFLYGWGGADALTGGSGDDYIAGGSGNDILVGGAGNDTLIGEAGMDRYVYTAETWGADTIHSFDANGEKLDFTGVGAIHSFADFSTHEWDPAGLGYNSTTLFYTADGTTSAITLIGVQAANLSDSDFLFA